MKIRAKLTIRNASLIEARKELGLSQRATAIQAGVSLTFLQRLEMLNYPNITADNESLIKLCAFLNLITDDLFPEELAGQSIQNKFESTAKVSSKNLLAFTEAYNSRLLLCSPEEEAIKNDEIALIKKFIDKLSYREKQIMELLFGLNKDGEYTIAEVGKIYKLTQSRIRMIKARAIRKIQEMSKPTA